MLAQRRAGGLSLSDGRSQAAATGGTLEQYARLGVGARAELRLLRADLTSMESRRGEVLTAPSESSFEPRFNV
jgi:hypothetical protein